MIDLVQGATGGEPDQLTVAGGVLYFSADDGQHGRELWSSDGSGAGTQMVRDLFPGAESGDPLELVAFAGGLAFSAEHGELGRELWRSNGTEAGTWAYDIQAGAGGSEPSQLAAWGDSLYLAADDGLSGNELWRDDGRGPYRLRDLVPGPRGSNPLNMTPLRGQLLFAADYRESDAGTILWSTDGTPAWTVPLHRVRL